MGLRDMHGLRLLTHNQIDKIRKVNAATYTSASADETKPAVPTKHQIHCVCCRVSGALSKRLLARLERRASLGRVGQDCYGRLAAPCRTAAMAVTDMATLARTVAATAEASGVEAEEVTEVRSVSRPSPTPPPPPSPPAGPPAASL